jgi:HPt (histidine-containing phosphotransfer) domain-containing protein
MQKPVDLSGCQYIDAAYLQELSNGDDGFILIMLTTFLEQAPLNLAAIQKAVKAQDAEAIYSTAHDAKSTYAYPGLKNVIAVLQQIELKARDAATESSLNDLLVELILQHNLCLVEVESVVEKNRNRLQI